MYELEKELSYYVLILDFSLQMYIYANDSKVGNQSPLLLVIGIVPEKSS